MRYSNMFGFIGRTTADIELKQAGEVPMCEFTLAVDRPYRKDKEKETDFFRLKAFRGKAEFISKHIPKGTLISVMGSVTTNSWEDKDGNKRYSTDFIVDDVDFVGPKNTGKTSDEGATEKPVSAPAVADDDSSDELPF